MKTVLLRILRVTTPLTAVILVAVALLNILAPRQDWAWTARAHLAAAVYRPFRFPGLATARDHQCSLAAAWREAVPERAIAARTIDRAMRQIREDGRLIEVEVAGRRMWIPGTDRLAFAEEIAEENEEEYGTGSTGIRAGDTVLDCGANVGAFTNEALRSGAARVVAIEPAPWALECLRRNFAEEIRSGKVILYPKGVWDRDDTLELNIPNQMATTAATVALDKGKGTSIAVPLTTIDQIVADLHLDRVDFVKMDIEGAELNALRGAADTVRRFTPRLVISLEHRPSDPEDIPALTRRLWPNYQTVCGPCTNMNEHLQPVVMYAHAATVLQSRR